MVSVWMYATYSGTCDGQKRPSHPISCESPNVDAGNWTQVHHNSKRLTTKSILSLKKSPLCKPELTVQGELIHTGSPFQNWKKNKYKWEHWILSKQLKRWLRHGWLTDGRANSGCRSWGEQSCPVVASYPQGRDQIPSIVTSSVMPHAHRPADKKPMVSVSKGEALHVCLESHRGSWK